MTRTRIIPVLLLKGSGLVKTERFANPRYIGDPLNAVRIFNDKEVDEIIFLDISATVDGHAPRYEFIRDLASECFMPVCYGGGIRNFAEIQRLFSLGIEKVCLTTSAVENESLITEASSAFGSQAIVANIDVKRDMWGRYRVWTHGGTKRSAHSPVDLALRLQDLGAGEIVVNSVDRDGTMAGYDLELIRQVASAVQVPVVALGGAGSVQDLADGVSKAGASAVAAGSLFVFHGPHRAVLITAPSYKEFQACLA